MLGEKFYDITGKVTGQRVLPGNGLGEVKVEVSYQGQGKLLGVDTLESGTYEAVMKAPGILHGTGQGLALTSDGEAVTWAGFGIGRPTGKGMAASWRACLHYTTASQKLAKLNGLCAVVEWEVDEAGNCKGGCWEWK